jgi:CubicO group peptidase (beta-lactamase class C family)
MRIRYARDQPDVNAQTTRAAGLPADVGRLAVCGRRREPGTRHGYHAITYGWLVGEVVRRISGRGLGTFFANEVAAPLGLDFWIGLPKSQLSRVSRIVDPFASSEPIDLSALPEPMRELLATPHTGTRPRPAGAAPSACHHPFPQLNPQLTCPDPPHSCGMQGAAACVEPAARR